MATNASSGSSYGAAYAGIQLATSLLDNYYARRLQARNQQLAEVSASARNRVTTARNIREGSRASLSSYIQSINNQRLVDSGAKKQAAAIGALKLGQEITASNSNERRMRASFAAGQLAAAAAFSGTIGGAPQRLQAALALRDARQEQQAKAEEQRRSFYIADEAALALSGSIEGRDNRTILPNRDESVAMAPDLPDVDSPLLAALKSGADFGRIVRAAGDITTYLRNRNTAGSDPNALSTEPELAPGPGAFSGLQGFFSFPTYTSPLDK